MFPSNLWLAGRKSLAIAAAGAVFFASGMIGCVPRVRLRPSPELTTLTADKKGAVVETAGVRLEARAQAWPYSKSPSDLEDRVTPFHLVIENHSGHPLSLRYTLFSIGTPDGLHTSALPPYQIKGTETRLGYAPYTPHFFHHGFYAAPYYAHYFHGTVPLWADPFPWDEYYYDNTYVAWETALPTQDMLEEAIPEGVLDDNGKISGFAYFRKLKPGTAGATLSFDLVDAKTNEKLGTVQAPFLSQKKD